MAQNNTDSLVSTTCKRGHDIEIFGSLRRTTFLSCEGITPTVIFDYLRRGTISSQ